MTHINPHKRSCLAAAAALCLIATAPALGQTVPPTAGSVPPAHSFSLDDDGTSLNSNPGGLGFASGLELNYLHAGGHGEGTTEADSFLMTGGTGFLTLGLGWDWVHHAPCSEPGVLCAQDVEQPQWATRRSSQGIGLKLGQLGIGATHHGFNGGDVHGFSSWDFGLLTRPFDWLSIGGAALDATRENGLPRRWQLSLGLRPIGEASEIAGDVRWTECTQATGLCGIDNYDLLITLRARIVKGAKLLGQVARLGGGNLPTSFLFGLQLDLPYLGVTYASQLDSDSAAGYRDAYRVRMSSEAWPSIVSRPRAALIDLDKVLHRPKASVFSLVLPLTVRDPFTETLLALRRIGADPGIKAVVLKSSGLPIGNGKAEELRTAMDELRGLGKKVIFYLESGGDLEYSVATSADRIYAAPQAVLTVNGFSATALFAAAGLDKLGVKAEFFRVGAWKNAPDTFTRSGMSSEQREVQGSLLDDVFGRYLKSISARRRVDEGKVKDLLDHGLLTPAEAVEAGLLDGVLYPDQLEEETGKLLGGKVSLEKTSIEPEATRETRWGAPARIAVIRVEGDILRGEGARTPLGAVEIAGSDPITRRIRRAADDPGVAAIVVRIDSPGGDGTASDLIWRELVRARKEKKKPVIASMGDVAASGGYYVAAGADEIWAEPSTITGSIGVFIGHFDAEALLDKLGLNLTTIKRGKSADIFTPNRSLTDDERKMMQGWVDGFYDQFVSRVAEARTMKKEDVDAIARGRVWTGAQASERGLVDYLGGFTDAIDSAKKKAGLGRNVQVEIDDDIDVSFDWSDAAAQSAINALPGNLAPRILRSVQLLGDPGTLRAVLPFDLEVR